VRPGPPPRFFSRMGATLPQCVLSDTHTDTHSVTEAWSAALDASVALLESLHVDESDSTQWQRVADDVPDNVGVAVMRRRMHATDVYRATWEGACANNDSTAPQSSAKYDALRTQPTGFASGGVVGTPMDASSPFSGGFMPQPTGMSVMPGMPAMTTGMPGAPGYMMPPGFYG